MMEFTGERFIPGAGLDSDIEIEHLQRYYSACKLVEGKTVLDAASGSGYGTHILAQSAAQVFGLEISEEAVSFSSQKYIRDNLHYSQGSIANLPFADQSLDVVVSFETIEHVDEELQAAFIREIKRVLKKDGILLMSSPDKRIYSDLPGYKNEHHVKEFYRDEFVDFLRPYFQNVRLYEQFAGLSYLMVGEKRQLERLSFNDVLVEGKYLVALCCDSEISPGMELDSLVIDGSGAYQDKIDRIFSLQDEIDEKNDVIDDKNTLVYRAYQNLFGQDEINDLQKENCDSLETSLQNKDLIIRELEAKLKDKDDRLTQLSGELVRIKNTLGYKILQKGYKVRNKLVPKR